MLFDFIAALEFFFILFFSSSRILCFCPRVAPCGHILSCSTEEMCRLPVASLIICFWLVERSYCNNSLQDSMRELHTRFAISLYQTLTETENNSNLIVSPVSVSLSLALLQLGARGNTLAQLEGTLGYNVNGRFLIFPLLKFLNRNGNVRFYPGGIRGSLCCVKEAERGWPSVLLVPGGVEQCSCCCSPCRA